MWISIRIESAVIGKGEKKAEIEVPSRLLDVLKEWIAMNSSDALVIGLDHQRLTTGQVRRRIQMIGAAAGIPDLDPHDLRHTYAYELKDAVMRQGLSEEKGLDAVRKQTASQRSQDDDVVFPRARSQIRVAVEAM